MSSGGSGGELPLQTGGNRLNQFGDFCGDIGIFSTVDGFFQLIATVAPPFPKLCNFFFDHIQQDNRPVRCRGSIGGLDESGSWC